MAVGGSGEKGGVCKVEGQKSLANSDKFVGRMQRKGRERKEKRNRDG